MPPGKERRDQGSITSIAHRGSSPKINVVLTTQIDTELMHSKLTLKAAKKTFCFGGKFMKLDKDEFCNSCQVLLLRKLR